MNLAPFGLLLGALALLSGGARKPKKIAFPAGESDTERVVREAREIIAQKRDAFSTEESLPEPRQPEPIQPMEDAPPASYVRPSAEDEALEAAIRSAVEQADMEAAQTAPPKPKPKPKPAAKPKPKPKPVAERKPKPKPAAERTAARADTTSTPSPVVTSQQPPPGYDPTGARRMAPSLARHLAAKGRAGYDRTMVKSFQTKAGISPDKVYGGETRGALLYYGGSAAPRPFFAPFETLEYVPWEER